MLFNHKGFQYINVETEARETVAVPPDFSFPFILLDEGLRRPRRTWIWSNTAESRNMTRATTTSTGSPWLRRVLLKQAKLCAECGRGEKFGTRTEKVLKS